MTKYIRLFYLFTNKCNKNDRENNKLFYFFFLNNKRNNKQ